MLANRCWAQARWGRNLDVGLAECDAAVKAAPTAVEALDGRGLIALRLGRLEMAIADFTAVQQAAPDAPWPLYARGVAELRAGLKAPAEADMLAARTLDPKIGDAFAEIGVKP
jgi:Flp pilus assembly protein TadD